MAVTILVLITLASNLLSIINSPTFQKAYKKFRSIEKARDELDKLKVTIETIQAVLVDAEKKQQGSDAVKKWIERVTDVLYDAEDLFDEVAFSDQHKKQGKSLLHNLKRVSTNDSTAKEVKAIRKRFLEISKDMEVFKFEVCLNRDEPIWDMRKGQDAGSLIDQDEVFGREQDKETILNALLEDSKPSEKFSVIAIVGIGGMGKTTLAQLVYNDEEVQKRFENKWFACISDTSDDEEILGKIFQSMSGIKDSNFTTNHLQSNIKKLVEDSNFLLVLDDVWDDDRASWQHRMRLLNSGKKGGKVIVTTRSSSVAKAMDAVTAHELQGLSENASWDLFKRAAFAQEDENDPRRIDLGRQIVRKCANVPLAIRSIGSLLYKKNSIREWESFKDQELSKLEEQGGDSIMNTLKLSYDHLPRNLKHCFAYCSLFPKDFVFEINKLIYLWIAHGYIEPDHEELGHSYFMDLLRMSFFQQATYYSYGALQSCKMHDLVHDLARHVAGEETVMLATPSYQFNKCARHVGVGWKTDDPWEVLAPRIDNNRLRSFVLMVGVSHLLSSTLDQQFTNFKRLRALSLRNLNIDNVSSSIGKLKHLRYLDLSHNRFISLPDSMTNLLNLITLEMEGCYNLKVLPDNFGNLVNLRCLNILGCHSLKHMPPGFGKLISLQYLSSFNVGNATEGVQRSGLGALSGLELRGKLMIHFDRHVVDEWDGDESWQLPVSPEHVLIMMYPGIRIPHWANGKANELTHLELKSCFGVKYLPPLRCLPYLKSLFLDKLFELEYIEDEDEERRGDAAAFFRCLEKLEMTNLPKLKGWSRNSASFPRLSQLKIEDCPEFKSMPLSPFIRNLELNDLDGEVTHQLLSSSPSLETLSISNGVGLTSIQDVPLASLRHIFIDRCCQLEALHLTAPHLRTALIKECDRLKSFRVAALTSLRCLKLYYCKRLMISHIAHPNILEELDVSGCPKLKMLEEESRGVDWHSIRSLRKLTVDKLPPTETLPRSLRHLLAFGRLQIIRREIYLGSDSDSDSDDVSSKSSFSSEQEA